MEAIITIVGFLGAGKTTLLKHLINRFTDEGWNPFVVLNDYENALMDAQQLTEHIDLSAVKALSGSCICCSGIEELRNTVNRIPERSKGITLIEANGTSDACKLIEFLGVGINKRFLPPVQIAVVNVKNWQKRGEHNELEANQIQVSSLLVLTHLEDISSERLQEVTDALNTLNPYAKVIPMAELDVTLLPELLPSNATGKKFDHLKAHWASCSVDLPHLPDTNTIYEICNALPNSILRVKGCTKIGNEDKYTYFERKPDGEILIRPFNGSPITGTKLLTIGAGSEPSILNKAVNGTLDAVRTD
ncbi:GTP-binding protein [Seonamhaeicola sp. ML3]|uniref:GTP-binding protein n=1 Tax=Seonamhaeicola sp. ML3 TaxID=2937786 RepID=UPI00200E88D7|nr:GTP-binding protein [Seonamhaeicola sp. ML3]